MHVIVVEFLIKPEFVDRFLAEIVGNARLSRETEAGCRQFDVARGIDDERKVVLYERYDSARAFEAHLQSAHFLQFDRKTVAWIERKVVHALQRIDPA